jgi:hypothetical protein
MDAARAFQVRLDVQRAPCGIIAAVRSTLGSGLEPFLSSMAARRGRLIYLFLVMTVAVLKRPLPYRAAY